ncbi:efflux transporter outer membrane subunit, partial [Phenylobacterium sp.]|uniref:efflux transporter outer membrane subunit n=1 Tax=Phenylobacterium sp. TaxID=1871053 RepID=UPI0019CE27A0
MNLSPILALTAGAALLSACAVGPSYETPTPPPAETGGFVSAQAGPFTAGQVPDQWWRLYDDPLLDDLVGQALAANRDVAVAAANLRQVRAALGEARSGLLPSTTVTGSAQRVRQQDQQTGVFEEADAFQAGFEAAYEVDFFGRVRRSIEAARADAGAAEALLDSARITVAAETARAYADLCAANLQIDTAQRTLSLQQDTFDLTRQQLDLGRGTGLDVARAQTQLESTRSTIPPLEAQRDSALFRLAVLTGRPPAEAPIAAAGCKIVPEVETAIPVGDGAALLARRPDVRAAERRLAAATARIGVATAALYPNVTLGGAISTLSADSGDLGDDYQFNV